MLKTKIIGKPVLESPTKRPSLLRGLKHGILIENTAPLEPTTSPTERRALFKKRFPNVTEVKKSCVSVYFNEVFYHSDNVERVDYALTAVLGRICNALLATTELTDFIKHRILFLGIVASEHDDLVIVDKAIKTLRHIPTISYISKEIATFAMEVLNFVEKLRKDDLTS